MSFHFLQSFQALSFLAYMLRYYPDKFKSYQETFPSCVIHLLRVCPEESTALRKELLIAMRHILVTDFRNAFIQHVLSL